MKEFSETTEQAVTFKRSKGGFVENHWGAKPSILQASGQVGLHLSAFGITPFQTEDPGGNRGETVLDWDPSNSTVLTNKATTMPDTSDSFSQQSQGLLNKGVNLLGKQVGGQAGSLLSNASFNNTKNNPTKFVPPVVNQSDAAQTGTNLAFRKFRLILDLFKHNGLVFDSLPNTSIYPATLTAPEVYTDAKGNRVVQPSLIKSQGSAKTLEDLRKHAQIAPGNVTASLPIQMYVKDTRYLGFFQNFNYAISEEDPYIATYDFTFIARLTERTGLFFPTGTAGKVLHQNLPGGSR
jgi:hypothetical protein